jgi:hypothetical protein
LKAGISVLKERNEWKEIPKNVAYKGRNEMLS